LLPWRKITGVRRTGPEAPKPSTGVPSDASTIEAPLHDGAREDADEAAVLDDRNALEVAHLEHPECLLQVERRLEREDRRLGDRAEQGRLRVEPGGDDLADERLARDDADQPPALADEHRSAVGVLQPLAGLLRGLAPVERDGIRHHRIADERHRGYG
jgi:hypothetical protein